MPKRTTRLKLHIAASRIHRWLALFVGAQLILWFASGLVMSLLPIDRVRGEHLIVSEKPRLPPNLDYAPINAFLGDDGASIGQLRFRSVLGRAVVDVELADGRRYLHDARTAERLPPIKAEEAQRIAVAAYRGRPTAPSVEPVTATSVEYKGPLPAWRIKVLDSENTRIYVSTFGEIAGVRTGTWRFYDFFWGLHIMDWSGHENFNTPWLAAFAFGGLLIAFAGAVLLFMRWPRRRRENQRLSMQ